MNWRKITQLAVIAKETGRGEKSKGIEMFKKLLEEYGEDGMIYLQWGELYEYHGEYDEALKCYEKARVLFPLMKWKEESLNRIVLLKKTVEVVRGKKESN